jgi:anti-sigma regulatory factor (Ser/Thr protein kinase)
LPAAIEGRAGILLRREKVFSARGNSLKGDIKFVSFRANEHRGDRQAGSLAMKKTKIEFSSHTGNLALMRNCVRRFLENFPFSERQRTLMVLGVDEACTNIIRHAYQLRDDQPISLCLEGRNGTVCVRLRDYGRKAKPDAMKSRPADLIKPGGLGLHLIRTAFDQVDYVLRSRGTELVLTKNLE